MLFEFNRFSAVLLIFFLHGLGYALLLFRKAYRQQSRSDYWLGIYLLLSIFFIAPWMVGFAGWYDRQPYRDILFYVPFVQLFFFGPVLYFYIQSLLNPGFRLTRKMYWHFLPGIIYLLYSLTAFVTDKIVLKRYYFLYKESDPDFASWYRLLGIASLIVYLALSIIYYNRYRRIVYQLVSYADAVLFRWARHFLIAFFSFMVFTAVFTAVDIFFVNVDYAGTWWYFLVYAVFLYYISIAGYGNSVQTKVAFRFRQVEEKQVAQITWAGTVSSAPAEEAIIAEENTAGPEAQVFWSAEQKQQLLQLLHGQKLYEDAELSLTGLARQVSLSPALLSRLINQGFGMNFNDFVNHYRVLAVQEKLRGGEQQSQTLLGIAFDCGFNSKATFNRAFKKQTGLSPREWIDKELVPPTNSAS
jgi:AraC-like DNA-binding protein